MARRVSTKIVGAKEIAHNLAAAGERWKNAVAAGLYMAANNVMSKSKRLVPVDLGALKGSGYVTLPQELAGSTVVEMGYGGPAKAYSVQQHERLDFKHPDGGQALFLSAAVDAATPTLASDILKLAKAAFAHGQGPTVGSNPTDPDSGQAVPRRKKKAKLKKTKKAKRGKGGVKK